MQNKPHPFNDVLTLLHGSLIETAPLEVTDPKLSSFLDSHNVFQQLALTQRLQEVVDENAGDSAAAANILLRSLGLLERTRARIARSLERLDAPDRPDRDEATNFLTTELSRGDRPAKDILALAQSIGISHRTLKRAKAQLNIISVQRALPDQQHCWVWSLNLSTTLPVLATSTE